MTTPSHPTKKEEHVPLYRVQDSRRLVIAVRLVNFAPRVATPNAFKDCSFLGPTTHTSSTNFLPGRTYPVTWKSRRAEGGNLGCMKSVSC